MTLETLAFQKAITEDNVNGLPVRLVDAQGHALLVGANGNLVSSPPAPTLTNLVAPRTDSASYISADLTPPLFTVALFVLHVTAISGTSPSCQLTLQGKDSQGGYNLSNGGASTSNLTATGITTALITLFNSGVAALLGPTYRLSVAIGGTGPSVTWFCDVFYK